MVASAAGLVARAPRGRPLRRRVASAARARFGRSLVSALDSVRTVKLAAATPSVHAAPARGRRRPRRRRGPRAPRAGAARRRPDRDGAGAASWPRGPCSSPAAGAWRPRCWSPARSTASTGSAGSPARSSPRRRAPAPGCSATSRLAGGGDLMRAARGRRPRARHRARAPRPRRATRCARLRAGRPHRGARRRHDRRQRRRPRPSAPGSWCCCSARSARASPACSSALAGLVVQHRRDPVERPSPSTTRRRSCGPAGSPTSPRCRGCCRARSPTTSRSTTPTGRCCRRSRPPAWRRTSRTPAAPTRWSATAASGSPAARCSGWRWPARWPATPSCCWPTTSRRRWTPPPRSSCGPPCAQRGATVIGATSKRAALAQADRVVVLVEGRVAAVGPWRALGHGWGHLAG